MTVRLQLVASALSTIAVTKKLATLNTDDGSDDDNNGLTFGKAKFYHSQ